MPPRGRVKVHGRRALLNLPGFQSTAAIVAEVQDTAGTDVKRPDLCLDISDCDRKVSMEFGSFTYHDTVAERDQEFENDLHKVDTLIEVLSHFRAGLLLEQRRFKQRKER